MQQDSEAIAMSHEYTSHDTEADPSCSSAHHQPGPPDSQFLQIASQGTPALAALQALAEVARDLLGRTAELPETEHGLLLALREYRYAVFAFTSVVEKL